MEEPMRIVLLGKTGAGKSSLANTICGEKDKFKESASPNSGTKECCAEDTTVNGRSVRLIDTPGLFDTDLNTTELSDDILRCIRECAPGPHAFLVVLRIERFTGQEQQVVDSILKYFSDDALKYTTVVFTHGDDLPEGMKIKAWAFHSTALTTLIQKCGGRVHVFDNKYWHNNQHQYRNNQVQIRELLSSIDQKNGQYYTNKYLKYLIDGMETIRSRCVYAARFLLGALLGQEALASVLTETIPSATTSFYQKENDTLRIVLLGKSGSGKSHLGNTLFGDKGSFKLNCSSSQSTQTQSMTGTVYGRNIQVIDPPGFCGTESHNEELKSELLRCVAECAPGPHAFLLVFKVERFTRLEQEMVKMIYKYFSEEALKYTTVVFTQGDALWEKMKIEDWVQENQALTDIVQKCGGRVHVFDNKYWNDSQDPYRNNQVQVGELLNTIEQTVRQNGGYYSNELLQKQLKIIEEENERIRQQQQQGKSWFWSLVGF